jgi:tetratricopeptide (TPR) repeat protein
MSEYVIVETATDMEAEYQMASVLTSIGLVLHIIGAVRTIPLAQIVFLGLSATLSLFLVVAPVPAYSQQPSPQKLCFTDSTPPPVRIAACTRLAELSRTDEDRAAAHRNRGIGHWKSGDSDLAIGDFSRAIQLSDDNGASLAWRCTVFVAKGELDRAIADCNQAIKLGCCLEIAYYARGMAFLNKRDAKRAITDLSEAIRLQPRWNVFYARGNAYYLQKDFEKAIVDYSRAIRLEPTYALAYLERGHAYKWRNEESLALADYDEYLRLQTGPSINVVFPSGAGASMTRDQLGVAFARSPLPSLAQVQQCKSANSDLNGFYECVVQSALPDEYRIGKECFSRNKQDYGKALVCSSQRRDLIDRYNNFRTLQECAVRKEDKRAVAQCLGQQVLGQNESYYLNCIASNRNLGSATVCAVGKDLTPEQQVALSCAVSSGGQAGVFAGCTGGQLLKRELEKCWEKGFATEGGCFGKNNEYVKFIRDLDEQAKQLMGENSAAYKA